MHSNIKVYTHIEHTSTHTQTQTDVYINLYIDTHIQHTNKHVCTHTTTHAHTIMYAHIHTQGTAAPWLPSAADPANANTPVHGGAPYPPTTGTGTTQGTQVEARGPVRGAASARGAVDAGKGVGEGEASAGAGGAVDAGKGVGEGAASAGAGGAVNAGKGVGEGTASAGVGGAVNAGKGVDGAAGSAISGRAAMPGTFQHSSRTFRELAPPAITPAVNPSTAADTLTGVGAVRQGEMLRATGISGERFVSYEWDYFLTFSASCLSLWEVKVTTQNPPWLKRPSGVFAFSRIKLIWGDRCVGAVS